MSGTRQPDPWHRRPTDADEPIRADRVRRPPRLRTQAAVVALVPALAWTLANPAAVLIASAVLLVAGGAVALARRHARRALRPAPSAE